MASSTGAGKAGGEEIDVNTLTRDKVKIMMRRDPKFIGRLIGGLDSQMHKLMWEKKNRLDQIAADEAEIAALEEREKTHILPHMTRLQADIKYKTELKERLAKEILAEKEKLNQLQMDATSVIQRARHSSTKLLRGTASQKLEEARGFSSTVPTTTLLRGKTGTTKS